MRFRSIVAGLLMLSVVPAFAGTEEGPPSAPEIAAIRADLEAARFEAVVAAATAFLARTDLPASDLAAALALRSQARVSQGNLAKAEEDWKRLLVLDPAYAPDPLTTGRKAIERFDKVQSTIVGTVRFVLDPPGAQVTLDGEPLGIPADATVRLAAGARRLAVSSPGFDAVQVGVDIVAGTMTPVEVRLLPNARRVVARTEPDGVEVWLEGRLVGSTRRDDAAAGPLAGPATLRLDPLPVGEHVLEFRKECFRRTRVDVLVSVDVLDRSPIPIPVVTLAPARSVVTLSGGTPGASVLWGGERVATLPLDAALALCAGTRTLEVRASGRSVWRGTVEIPEEGEAEFDIAPRPNAAIVGADRWPADLAAVAPLFGSVAGLPVPGGADLSTPAGWGSIALPEETDLAVAVLPAPDGAVGLTRVYVYSPWLGSVAAVTSPPVHAARRPWRRPWLGWHLADSLLATGVIVVEAVPGGPATVAGVAAGDRVVAIGGRSVASVTEAQAASERCAEGVPVNVSVAPYGEAAARDVKIVPVSTPLVGEPEGLSAVERAIAAAYAAVDGAGSADAASALATLGVMLIREGRAERAIDVLRRARFETREGVGEGTVAYLLGRALAAAGREGEAREAFRRARQSRATAFSDDGPEIAPAAADHLADLGVTVR